MTKLTERDLKFLATLGDYELMTTSQIAIHVFAKIDKKTVLRRLRKIEREDENFASSLIAEAHDIHKKQGNLAELEKLQGKTKALEDQIEALAEHLLKIPKTLSPLPVYRQMERIAKVKEQVETELQQLEANAYQRDIPIAVKDYKSYLAKLKGLLSGPERHELRAKIVSRLIYKIEIKPDGFRLHHFVGKRELSHDDENAKAAKPPVVLSAENKKGTDFGSVPFLKFFGSNTLDCGRGDRI